MLLATEAVILTIGLWFPHTSADYQAFFITHERTCWLPPAEIPVIMRSLWLQDIELSKLTPEQSCYLVLRGWHQNGSILSTMRPRASLALPIPPGSTNLAITLAGSSPGRAERVDLQADHAPPLVLTLPGNGQPLTAIIHAPGESVMTLTVLRTGLFPRGSVKLQSLDWQFLSGTANPLP